MPTDDPGGTRLVFKALQLACSTEMFMKYLFEMFYGKPDSCDTVM
jgi:hypothetical protein